jgi:uncharacterized protein (TIGR03067 family)
MRYLWIVATVVLSQIVASYPVLAVDNQDNEVVKGEWRLVGWEDSGKQAPTELVKTLTEFRIIKGEITICGKDYMGKETKDRANIITDSSKSPKQIDLTVVDGLRKGEVIRGIYMINNNKLHICLNAEGEDRMSRPKEFRTGPNEGTWLLTFETDKSK